MALILNIDTATENAHVCLADNGNVIAKIQNTVQKNHASFLHLSIKKIFKSTAINFTSIDSIAIVAGPGSYTGLRIGMATAKGLCYALQKPLILLNLLEIMTSAVIDSAFKDEKFINWLFCPLVDARRKEVFTALYDKQLNELISPRALILKENFLSKRFSENDIIFFGNGLAKFNMEWLGSNKVYTDSYYSCNHISELAFKKSKFLSFPAIDLNEPLYFKNFFNV